MEIDGSQDSFYILLCMAPIGAVAVGAVLEYWQKHKALRLPLAIDVPMQHVAKKEKTT